MKVLSILLLAASCVSAANVIDSEHPRTPRRIWVRRLTLAAGCAASLAFDTWSTQRAVSAGALEANRLFANPQGQPQWTRMISIKAGVCGASAILQETHLFRTWESPAADWTWTGVNAGAAGLYSWTSWHNFSLASRK
ncbi:MAG TPA: hypothetical protein VKX39_15950 [Bryobacteraceae bacterium]|nr:hypothetical protein [Bryobacteraceae bacterium]